MSSLLFILDVTDYAVMKLCRSGFDLRHGPPAYESDMLPGMLSYSENGKYPYQCLD